MPVIVFVVLLFDGRKRSFQYLFLQPILLMEKRVKGKPTKSKILTTKPRTVLAEDCLVTSQH